MDIFNIFGYDDEGYDKNGYDSNGYNRNGYDKQGFDRDGFTKDGFDKYGFNKQGINCDGINRKGYDTNGYDKYGYDIDGYDSNGLNKNGFDKNGYDKSGFNKEGYNNAGFDKNGYDQNGYDTLGYNEYGFNCLGYRKDGFDKYGYDINGYDINGSDRYGYNKDGFDSHGYDKFGFDINGFDKNGLNIDGEDIWGYNTDKKDKDGYNKLGFKDGYDFYGYDIDGFNQYGYDIDGYSRDEFDINGFHKITGYNREGIDINGYNVSGIKVGQSEIDNSEMQYSEDGKPYVAFNEKKYLKSTIAETSFDDPEALIKSIKQIKSENKDTSFKAKIEKIFIGKLVYHKTLGKAKIVKINFPYFEAQFVITKEVLKFSFNSSLAEWITFSPNSKFKFIEANMDKATFVKEQEILNNTLAYIRDSYSEQLKKSKIKLWSEKEKQNEKNLLDSSGFQFTWTPDYSTLCEDDYNRTMAALINFPYFAHVTIDKDDFYISKNDDYQSNVKVINWQSPDCQVYYQYQYYIGNEYLKIKLIRDLSINRGKLHLYVEKYNLEKTVEVEQENAETYLDKLILSARENKITHDIIASIQHNQYSIITEKLNNNLLVLGCAGSGKTMIMIHRISYLLYNYKDLTAEDIYILSPTKYLSFENSQLSKILKLDAIKKMITYEMYSKILKGYDKIYDLKYDIAPAILSSNKNLHEVYDFQYIDSFANSICDMLSPTAIIDTTLIDDYIKAVCIGKNCIVQTMDNFEQHYFQYSEWRETCKKYYHKDIVQMLDNLKSEKRDVIKLLKLSKLLKYFNNNDCFIDTDNCSNFDFKNYSIKQILKDFNFLTILIDNFEILQSELSIKHENRKIAVVTLLSKLYRSKIAISNIDIENIFYSLKNISSNKGDLCIAYICDMLKKHSMIEYYESILGLLLSKQQWFKDEKQKKDKPTSNKYSVYLNDIINLFQAFGWDGTSISDKYKITDGIITPFDYFDMFTVLTNKEERMKNYPNGNRDYLQDFISYLVDPQYSIYKTNEIKYEYQAYLHAYICSKVFGLLSDKKQYVYIDEYQDLTLAEIAIIKTAYPNTIFNFYGDLKQCIHDKSDKDKEKILALVGEVHEFYIGENYRNARQITDYINESLDMNMNPIGVDGYVGVLNSIDLSGFEIEKDDRVAYIVKDKEHLDYDFMRRLGILEGWKGEQSMRILKNVPVAYTIQDIKGLEFEVVIVDNADMSYNEKYVAYTRALNKLYLINE